MLRSAVQLSWLHWAVVGLSIGLTLSAWLYSRTQLDAKLALTFEREAERAIELVIERMEKYEDALHSGVAFIDANGGQVDYRLWERYLSSIQVDKKYPGINGMGLIVALDRDDVPTFLERRRTTCSSFKIHPARDGQDYWPITSIIPLQGNEQALGLDMAHEANRIAAARRARETGTPQITGPIVLVQDSMKTPGFLFFAPAFKHSVQGGEADDEFVGLVYAPFVVRKLMQGVLEKQKRRVGMRISDGTDVLFDEHVETEADFDPQPIFSKVVSVPLYGRTWSFDVRSAQSFRQSVDTSKPITILVAGLIIDGLLIGLMLMLSRASQQARGRADALTADVEKLTLAARVNEIGIWDYDPVTRELKWEDEMFALYGLARRDFNGAYEAWSESLHPDDRDTAERQLRECLAGSGNFCSEFRIVRPDGAVRHISAKAVVFRDAAGRPIRVLGANTDVTERHRAACELDATRRLQAAILDAAGVAIIATDPAGTIVTFNNAAEQMLGYSRDEMLGKQTPGVFHDAQEVSARADELSGELGTQLAPGFEVFVAKAAEGAMEQREWTYVRKDGSTFPVLLTVTALRDQHNAISGYLGIAADISDRRKARQNLERANQRLSQSNEELAQFAYVASHDLQEPLRKVTMFCQLLQEDCSDALTPDGRQYIDIIVDGATRMRTLIQDLLAYSRIDSSPNSKRSFDVTETVKLVIDDLGESIRQSAARVTYDQLPTIEADPRQMAQLFQNLIGNAIKYRGPDDPKIHISGQTTESGWRFTVTDNGIGIEPKFRNQIFGIFKRLHNRNEYPGTGIGLAVCKRIIDRLGGRIWVEDAEDGGSVFVFEFRRSSRSVGPPQLAPTADSTTLFSDNSIV